MNAITYKEVFPLIKENRIWMGMGSVKRFEVREGNEKSEFDKSTGKWYQKFGNICWFTNLSHKKRNEKLILYKQYSPEEYPHYDNYDAIEVGKTKEIPKNWGGAMGVPITFLDKYNPKQFEILGQMATTKVTASNFGYPYINGVRKYARIIIRNKQI